MNALTVQNPHHKCDWETRMTTENNCRLYLTVIIIIYYTYIYVCVCVCYNLHSSPSKSA